MWINLYQTSYSVAESQKFYNSAYFYKPFGMNKLQFNI